MTVRTQVAMQTQIDTLLANSTSAGITPSDLRSVCQDLVDTAEDRWLDDTVSPQYNNGKAVDALITSLLADNTAGDISPADVRNNAAVSPITRLMFGISDIVFDLQLPIWSEQNWKRLWLLIFQTMLSK